MCKTPNGKSNDLLGAKYADFGVFLHEAPPRWRLGGEKIFFIFSLDFVLVPATSDIGLILIEFLEFPSPFFSKPKCSGNIQLFF